MPRAKGASKGPHQWLGYGCKFKALPTPPKFQHRNAIYLAIAMIKRRIKVNI